MGVDDLADRLDAIAEELGDLAFDRLREASAGCGPGPGRPTRQLAEERRSHPGPAGGGEGGANLLRGPRVGRRATTSD